MFDLTIKEEVDFSITNSYDIIVIDYGLFGDMNLIQMKQLEKLKTLFVTSAMPHFLVKKDGCTLPYVEFQFEYMGLDLKRKTKGLKTNEDN